MTLLIGSRSPKYVVITADGLSIETKGGCRSVTKTDLTKVFPVPNAPVAVAHHGENVLCGKRIKQVVAEEFASDAAFLGSETPDAIADRLVSLWDASVRSTLSTVTDAKNCAFWVCGYASTQGAPCIVEVKWQKEPSGIDFRRTTAGVLFLSGDGHEFVKRYTTDPIDGQFSWDKLWKGTEKYHIRYHEKLWKLAEQEQAAKKEQRFGGKKTRLVITPHAWRWETAP